MAREIGTVAHILTATEKEHLNTSFLPIVIQSENIGIAEIADINILLGLNSGQRLDTVPKGCSHLIVLRITCRLHLSAQLCLNILRPPFKKLRGLIHLRGIFILGYIAHTRRRATFNMILQTRTTTIIKDIIGAVS